MTIAITPEPTPEELVVITAAIAAVVREGTGALPDDTASDRTQPSRWAHHGRAEAMRGLDERETWRR